jgi:hypothetical protein
VKEEVDMRSEVRLVLSLIFIVALAAAVPAVAQYGGGGGGGDDGGYGGYGGDDGGGGGGGGGGGVVPDPPTHSDYWTVLRTQGYTVIDEPVFFAPTAVEFQIKGYKKHNINIDIPILAVNEPDDDSEDPPFEIQTVSASGTREFSVVGHEGWVYSDEHEAWLKAYLSYTRTETEKAEDGSNEYVKSLEYQGNLEGESKYSGEEYAAWEDFEAEADGAIFAATTWIGFWWYPDADHNWQKSGQENFYLDVTPPMSNSNDVVPTFVANIELSNGYYFGENLDRSSSVFTREVTEENGDFTGKTTYSRWVDTLEPGEVWQSAWDYSDECEFVFLSEGDSDVAWMTTQTVTENYYTYSPIGDPNDGSNGYGIDHQHWEWGLTNNPDGRNHPHPINPGLENTHVTYSDSTYSTEDETNRVFWINYERETSWDVTNSSGMEPNLWSPHAISLDITAELEGSSDTLTASWTPADCDDGGGGGGGSGSDYEDGYDYSDGWSITWSLNGVQSDDESLYQLEADRFREIESMYVSGWPDEIP